MAHRILLVEDDEAILEVFSIFLTNRNYIVECARNVAEACAFCQQNRYSAVISDLNFDNEQTGAFGFIEQLARQESKPRIIACSGFATQEIREQALLKGADLFFAKPFAFSSFIESLKHLLDSSPTVDSVQKKAATSVLVQHDDHSQRAALPL